MITVREVKAVCIALCLKKGVEKPTDIKRLLRNAASSIGPMSVAGFKAAKSKGQNVPVITC